MHFILNIAAISTLLANLALVAAFTGIDCQNAVDILEDHFPNIHKDDVQICKSFCLETVKSVSMTQAYEALLTCLKVKRKLPNSIVDDPNLLQDLKKKIPVIKKGYDSSSFADSELPDPPSQVFHQGFKGNARLPPPPINEAKTTLDNTGDSDPLPDPPSPRTLGKIHHIPPPHFSWISKPNKVDSDPLPESPNLKNFHSKFSNVRPPPISKLALPDPPSELASNSDSTDSELPDPPSPNTLHRHLSAMRPPPLGKLQFPSPPSELSSSSDSMNDELPDPPLEILSNSDSEEGSSMGNNPLPHRLPSIHHTIDTHGNPGTGELTGLSNVSKVNVNSSHK